MLLMSDHPPRNLIRVFIAVDPNNQFRKNLAELTSVLRSQFDQQVKWDDPEKFHLTLAFLGEVDRVSLNPIREACRTAAENSRSFSLRFDHTGAFPANRKPTVLWIGCQPSPSLDHLVRQIREALSQSQVIFDQKPFHAHLTLARINPDLPSEKSAELTASLKQLDLSGLNEQTIKSVTIYQSELKRSGARYTPLAQFALKR